VCPGTDPLLSPQICAQIHPHAPHPPRYHCFARSGVAAAVVAAVADVAAAVDRACAATIVPGQRPVAVQQAFAD